MLALPAVARVTSSARDRSLQRWAPPIERPEFGVAGGGDVGLAR